MSGVQRLVLANSKGLEVPTNEELREEGVATEEEKKETTEEKK